MGKKGRRAESMKKGIDCMNRVSVAVACCVALLVPHVAKAVPASSLPSLSALTNFTTLGNNSIESNVKINGNVGVSANGTFNLMAPSTVNGNVLLADSA